MSVTFSVLLTGSFPTVVVGDSQGWIHIWSTRPAQIKNILLHKFQNIHLPASSSSSSSVSFDSFKEGDKNIATIQCLAFFPSNLYLVTGIKSVHEVPELLQGMKADTLPFGT